MKINRRSLFKKIALIPAAMFMGAGEAEKPLDVKTVVTNIHMNCSITDFVEFKEAIRRAVSESAKRASI